MVSDETGGMHEDMADTKRDGWVTIQRDPGAVGSKERQEEGCEPEPRRASSATYDRSAGRLRELSLFTGAGGGLLGSMLLGWSTVAAVESDPYCQRLLCARGGYMADCSGEDGFRDCTESGESDLPGMGGSTPLPIHPDVRTFHPAPGSCDIVTGGFPCQPHSQAGKRKGGLDDRDLWPDTLRILRESDAPLGFFENVPGLLTSRDAHGESMFGHVLGDLSEAGFDAEWCVLGADDVGAPHRRKRLWILAYRDGGRCEQRDAGLGAVPESYPRSPWHIDPADVGDAEQGLCGRRPDESRRRPQGRTTAGGASGREPEPGLGFVADGLACGLGRCIPRVAVGVPERVNRLRSLGNGQVPLTMAAAFVILARRAGVLT